MAKLIFLNKDFSLKAKEAIIHYGVDFKLDLGIGKAFQSLTIPKPINANFDLSIRLSYMKDGFERINEIKNLAITDDWIISNEEINDYMKQVNLVRSPEKLIIVYHHKSEEAYKVGFPSIEFEESFELEYKTLFPMATNYHCVLWYAEKAGSSERIVYPTMSYLI